MDILKQADNLVNGDRQKAYDHPSRNFQRTADLWNGYLDAIEHKKLDPKDVAFMMMLVKMGREIYKHSDDSLVDLVGYTLCLEKIIKDK